MLSRTVSELSRHIGRIIAFGSDDSIFKSLVRDEPLNPGLRNST